LADRYRTVEEFWDDLAEATLPPTRPLTAEIRKPSAELEILPDELTQAPPQPRFQTALLSVNVPADGGSIRRPKIVVPISGRMAQTQASVPPEIRPAKEIVAAIPDRAANGKPLPRRPVTLTTNRPRRLLVALILILAFSGMLLATHKYVTSHWNPLVDIPKLGDVFVVGREGVTTTDVNLRPDASVGNPAIGLVENGSRIKVISTNNNWYEVQVLQHARTKTDPFSSDRGWINKKFVKFD
jgi:hypothetical protein